MKSFLFSVLLVAAALLPSPVAAKETWIASARGQIVIDRDGSVAEVTIEKQLGPAVDAAVNEQIRSWRFEPIVENGRIVQAVAHMQFSVHSIIEGDENAVQLLVTDVTFVDPPTQQGSSVYRRVVPPKYPASMVRERLGAQVELLVEVAADGSVLRAAQSGGGLYSKQDRVFGATYSMQVFAKASVNAVLTWQFEPSKDDQVYYATVPIVFKIDTLWNRFHPVELKLEPWLIEHDPKLVVKYGADGAKPDARVRLLTAPERVSEG